MTDSTDENGVSTRTEPRSYRELFWVVWDEMEPKVHLTGFMTHSLGVVFSVAMLAHKHTAYHSEALSTVDVFGGIQGSWIVFCLLSCWFGVKRWRSYAAERFH